MEIIMFSTCKTHFCLDSIEILIHLGPKCLSYQEEKFILLALSNYLTSIAIFFCVFPVQEGSMSRSKQKL